MDLQNEVHYAHPIQQTAILPLAEQKKNSGFKSDSRKENK